MLVPQALSAQSFNPIRHSVGAGTATSPAISFTANATRLLVPTAMALDGTAWFVVTATVLDHFSEFYLNGCTEPLPVELNHFSAARRGANRVETNWRAASETNSAGFVVERSTDGRAFTAVSALLPGAATSATPHTYSFADLAAPSRQLYYRLRQVDTDSTMQYSSVVSVAPGRPQTLPLTLWPNPAHDIVSLDGLDGSKLIELLDATGRVVRRSELTAGAPLDLTGLPAGRYTVRTEDGRAAPLAIERP
jgi:hypothetical protein